MKRSNFDMIASLAKLSQERFGEIPNEVYDTMKLIAEEDFIQPRSVEFVIKVINEGVMNGCDLYNIRYALGCLGYEVTE